MFDFGARWPRNIRNEKKRTAVQEKTNVVFLKIAF